MDIDDLLRRGGVYDTIQAGIRYWWEVGLGQEADAQEIRRNPYAGPEALLTGPGPAAARRRNTRRRPR